jgi:hypothetical protein
MTPDTINPVPTVERVVFGIAITSTLKRLQVDGLDRKR